MQILEIDGHRLEDCGERTLFECAEELGVGVPTSCRAQGRCRECLVEVEAGGDLLSAVTEEEAHLSGTFRLACRTRMERPGTVSCHTLRRNQIGIVDTGEPSLALPLTPSPREAPANGRLLGVAVDLGTTTVTVRLHDLVSGALVASQSFENPQRFGGSDIMARIHYDSEHPGRLLQRTLLGYLRQVLEAFPAPTDQIQEVAIAGNTTMRDLFFGLDVSAIGQKPYCSSTEHAWRAGEIQSTALCEPARRFGLGLHKEAQVYGLPLISSHVGGDAAACLLATHLHQREELTLLLDIGTNTEVFLGNKNGVLAASCPAGPAFEGGGVLCGMPGLEGAIEDVRLDERGHAHYRVIGGAPPLGICGSGLVALLGELLRLGRMNEQGRLGESHFELTEAIRLTEADISELAQAKGANVAGQQIVADIHKERFGPGTGIERVLLAGGFARHLDVEAAMRIGLVPDLPLERIERVGNASIEGASRALLSLSERQALEDAVTQIEHIELETHPKFFDFFVDGCQFKPFRPT